MADETAELLVSIRADLSDLKAKFEEGKHESKEFSEGLKEGFHELGKEIAEVFAAEKIKEFFMEGINEFAEFDKQLTLTQFNLERLGQATEGSKEKHWAMRWRVTRRDWDASPVNFQNLRRFCLRAAMLSRICKSILKAWPKKLDRPGCRGNCFI